MQIYNVTLHPEAENDLIEIYSYIMLESLSAAIKVTDNIMDKIEGLSQFPSRCRLVPDGFLAIQGYRMLVIDSYIVFFKIFDETVLIYRILHGKRYFPELLSYTGER